MGVVDKPRAAWRLEPNPEILKAGQNRTLDGSAPPGTGVACRNEGLEAAAKLADDAAEWHRGFRDTRPEATREALAALARRLRARKDPEPISQAADDVSFTAIGPTGPFGHLCIGPVNWSHIERIVKADRTRADSFEFADRDRYGIDVVYEDGRVAYWDFERDQELRDKVFALIVSHQVHDLKSYG
jgi:hypothetical protein